MPVVATAGSNHHGQLGRGGDTSFFEIVDIQDDIVQVCCGADYTLAVNRSGGVYGWGRNESGQLAMPAPIVEHPTRIDVSLNDRIVKVSCGEAHSLFLTLSGEIYSSGEGSCGQRGDGTYHGECFELRRVLLEECAKDIFCGAHTSFAVTDDGDLYGWGDATTGTLGTSAWHTPTLSKPTCLSVVPPQTRISRVVASEDFALIMTAKAEILGSGSNKNGQLGISEPYTCTWRPIRDVGHVSDVACGSRLTVCHQIEKNRCIVLSNQLESFTVPNLTGLAAGDDNILAWTDGGNNLLVYGHNRYGQLGVGTIPFVGKLTHVLLPKKTNIVNVSCGRRHTCLLLSGDEVRDKNHVPFMEDSLYNYETVGKDLRTQGWGKFMPLGLTYLSISLAALAAGALFARYNCHRV